MDRKKIGKRILKIIGHVIVDVLIVILLMFALFYFFEDEIKDEVLYQLNQGQNGEIEIEEIDLAILKYFPFISLQLREVVYHERKWGEDPKHSSVISEINNLDVSLNIIDLIQGSINIEKLTIEGGKFNLIVYPDSSINLLNALGSTSSEEDTSKMEFILKNVMIMDLNLLYENNIGNQKAAFRVDRWTNNLALRRDLIYCQLDLDGVLQNLSIDDNVDLKNENISAGLELIFNLDSLSGELNKGKIEIDDLVLLANGKFGFSNNSLAEIDLELSDENIELLSGIFSGNLLEKQGDLISQGSLYGKGNIKWESFDLPPIIEFKFGFNDLKLILPQDTTLYVYLDFDGNFNTGKNPNLSEMKFELTDFEIRLPGGRATGSFSMNDWQNPVFDIALNADLNLKGYEKIFNIQEIDSLKGRLTVQSRLSGNYSNISQILKYDNENANVTIENVSFVLPNFDQELFQINGHIAQSAHTISFQDLSVLSPGGSLKLKGKISNLYSQFLNVKESLSGNLQVNSSQFRLDKILGKDDGLVKVIGREMNNFYADVSFKNQALKDTLNSRQFINVHRCSFGLKNYPDVHRFTGELVIQSKNVNFKNLQLQTDSGNLITNGDLSINPESAVDLNSSIYLTDFFINKFASKNPEADVIRMDISGKFNGTFDIKKGEPDDFLYISDFQIDRSNFYYLNKSDSDTVSLRGLEGDLGFLAVNVSDGDKILSTLDVSGIIKSKNLTVNGFNHRNLETLVDGKSGEIRLSKNQIEIFGIHGETIIDVDFTDDIYSYRIEQNVKGHDINHIFDTVTENDLVDGSLDISIWLEMDGNSWEENLKTLRGQISNRGKDLRIMRVDIDAIVKNFRDTQNFKLMDVGAFVFAGPAGAVVTKSVDYANLLRMNPGDSTVIGDFISVIEINEGKAHIEDMAFSTRKNRIVFGGDIDLANLQFVDFVIAIVNKDGCIELSQKLNGPFADPQLEEFSAIGTILAPITNAYNSIIGKDCTPFYTGVITHPN
jgi:uncharacterized protein involved in outer membrane biogenesis